MEILFLIIVIGFIVLSIIIGINEAQTIKSMTPKDIEEAKRKYEQEKKERARQAHKRRVYKSRYDYWYDKSYDVIDGYAIQSASKRHAYAHRHAIQDLKKYRWE